MSAIEEAGIDLNRGVTKRKDPSSGIMVCMYKDQPGIFYDLRGGLLSPNFAKEAGFDIKELEKQKEYNTALDSAKDALNEEFSGVKERETLHTEGSFSAIACAYGNADIYRDGDHKMNTVAMKAKEAVALVKQLAKQEVN